MEKDVLISIRGLQYLMDEESGEQEPVEVMTTGSYYKKNGFWQRMLRKARGEEK